jgi:phospholipid/cholesterol/gamma-HCH transport system substrate-binding protein
VRIAGVDVGAIEAIDLDGNNARLTLEVRSEVVLPTDTIAELRSSGMLGDRYIGLDLGRAETTIPDGGRLQFGDEPGDLDTVMRQVELISEDVKAITGVMREMLEDERNTDHVESTLANVDVLSEELRLLATQNRQDIHAIVSSVRRLTENLEQFSVDATADVDEELEQLKSATDKLDRALEDMASITGKIDDGEGTIGALINDRQTVDALNDTVENANEVIESFSGLRAEVYYLGRFFVGTQPADLDTFFYGNPVASNPGGNLGYSGSNNLGIELHPQEDFWWIFEINDYPQGTIRSEEHLFPDSGQVYTEWVRDQNYRFTFQMAKRWWDVGLRLGVKESGGGVGITGYLLRDRLQVGADVFDFAFGSYPALEASGLPNLRLSARAEPIHHLWVEAGAEQVLLGARYGYATGYIGAGFHFSDDDIKLLFATLPLPL